LCGQFAEAKALELLGHRFDVLDALQGIGVLPRL
jgi:hypothetical protein